MGFFWQGANNLLAGVGQEIVRVEDWSGQSTVMNAGGAAVYGLGFSVPPPTSLGYPTDKVQMFFGAPLQITAAGNGNLPCVLAEFTSAAPVVVATQFNGKSFLAGANSGTDAIPTGFYETVISGTARQFALYGYLLIDGGSLLTANIRSLAGGNPRAFCVVNAA